MVKCDNMSEDYTPKRRDVLKTSGTALATATGAGCLDGGSDDPQYEDDAQELIESATDSVDPLSAIKSNYVIGEVRKPTIQTEGSADLNNVNWVLVDAFTNENFGQYVSGGQFDKEKYGEATGSELAKFQNNINDQLNEALEEKSDEFEEQYGFRPSTNDPRRPKASPVMAGTEVKFQGNDATTLVATDAMPLETEGTWDEMKLGVEQEEGFIDRLF